MTALPHSDRLARSGAIRQLSAPSWRRTAADFAANIIGGLAGAAVGMIAGALVLYAVIMIIGDLP